MKIQILGTGCPKCLQLVAKVEEAMGELGLTHEVEKVTDIDDILSFGVMMTPALAVNGEVKSVGSIPKKEQIMEFLREDGQV